MIDAGTVPDLPGLSNYNPSVKVNIERNTTLNVRDGSVTETATGLKPGQRFDLLYRVQPNTRQVVIVLSNVMPILPPENGRPRSARSATPSVRARRPGSGPTSTTSWARRSPETLSLPIRRQSWRSEPKAPIGATIAWTFVSSIPKQPCRERE